MDQMSRKDDIMTPVVIAESPDQIYLAADCGYWTLGERALARCALDDLKMAAEDRLDDADLPYTTFPNGERRPARAMTGQVPEAKIIAELSEDGVITLSAYDMSETARAYFRMQS